jgi:hypothetical protein
MPATTAYSAGVRSGTPDRAKNSAEATVNARVAKETKDVLRISVFLRLLGGVVITHLELSGAQPSIEDAVPIKGQGNAE